MNKVLKLGEKIWGFYFCELWYGPEEQVWSSTRCLVNFGVTTSFLEFFQPLNLIAIQLNENKREQFPVGLSCLWGWACMCVRTREHVEGALSGWR